MRQLLQRFMFDQPEPVMIDGYGLPPPDPELVKRNQERVNRAIAGLGHRWVLFNNRAAQDQEDTRAAHSYTLEDQ